MSFAKRKQVSITTAADGSATARLGPFNGRVLRVELGAGFDNLVDITIVGATSGEPVLSLTNHDGSAARWAPRRALHDTTGAAALYAAAGSPVLGDIWLIEEDVSVVVAQGGNAKTATLALVVG